MSQSSYSVHSILHLFCTSLTYNSQTKLAPTAKSCMSTFIEAARGECPSAADLMALTMSSWTAIWIPALPPTLTAKSSSTQDSSCHLWDRTYMRMMMVTLMVMAKAARTLSAQAGTRPRRSAGQMKRSSVSCLMVNRLTPPRCPPLSLQVCPNTHSHTYCSQHPLLPTTPQQPSPSRISPSPHSPPHTPAHPTRTLPHTPQNMPTERAVTTQSPPPPSRAHGLHTIFSMPHNPFGSLIAASTSSATTAGTFDLKQHNQQCSMP